MMIKTSSRWRFAAAASPLALVIATTPAFARHADAKAPTDQPYGIREFGLRDVNGVDIVFGPDIEHN